MKEREMNAVDFPLHLFFMVSYSQMMWADCVRDKVWVIYRQMWLSMLARLFTYSKELKGK